MINSFMMIVIIISAYLLLLLVCCCICDSTMIESASSASVSPRNKLLGNEVTERKGGDVGSRSIGKSGMEGLGEYHLPANHRYGDLFELEDAATSNSWSGPQSGTGAKAWICITSDSRGINLAAGSYNSGIYYSRDGGSSWSISTGGYPVSGITWESIASSSTGQYVVVGSLQSPGQLWSSITYGESFVSRCTYFSGQIFDLGGLAMSSDGTKIIAALKGLGVLRYSINTGTGHVTQIGSTYNNNNAGCVSSDFSFTTLTVGISSGGIYYTSNRGDTWTKSDAPTSVTSWLGITSSADGKYLAACTAANGVYYSQDSGVRWMLSSTNTPTSAIYGIASSSSGQTMVAAVSGANKIYLSFNYGQSWQVSNSISISNEWFGVAISGDGGTIYGAHNNNGIYKSITAPTSQPSTLPSVQPSRQPSCQPSMQPTSQPTIQPSLQPSMQPTTQPTIQPTQQPSSQPSLQPFSTPSMQPTQQPTTQPSALPNSQPSMQPSLQPFRQPTSQPSSQPRMQPTMQPSIQPTEQPLSQPSVQPIQRPSSQPSLSPSTQPSMQPITQPTIQPSSKPSVQPFTLPSIQLSSNPSGRPSMQPSNQPVIQPSVQPSIQPTLQPTTQPTIRTSGKPTLQPLSQASAHPTFSITDDYINWQQIGADALCGFKLGIINWPSNPTAAPTPSPTAHSSASPSSFAPSMYPTANTVSFTGWTCDGAKALAPFPCSVGAVNWTGVTCGVSGEVNKLVLNSKGFKGSISSSISALTGLTNLTLNRNSFSGSMPSEISTLTNLQFLQFDQNSLSGLLPPQISHLMDLRYLSLNKNNFRGSAGSFLCISTITGTSNLKLLSNLFSCIETCAATKAGWTSGFFDTVVPVGNRCVNPTSQPSSDPSHQPSQQPSRKPSCGPSMQPSTQPIIQPSSLPTLQPSMQPSSQPTMLPLSGPSHQPSQQPSRKPSCRPSQYPTQIPSSQPTTRPSTPTSQPSSMPSIPTSQPSRQPSKQPFLQPTSKPRTRPTSQPSLQPTTQPSRQPISQPSSQPTRQPSIEPSSPSCKPSRQPTQLPSSQPSSRPSTPSSQPSSRPSTPSSQPSSRPSTPSSPPSRQPSCQPSQQPTKQPVIKPSSQPSNQPTIKPSRQPSSLPSSPPSNQPLSFPTNQPSSQPSRRPLVSLRTLPSSQPSIQPSFQPSSQPSSYPTQQPSQQPSTQPTMQPLQHPAAQPSSQPTLHPSQQPASQPTSQPSLQPYSSPTTLPSTQPLAFPSLQPSSCPSWQPTAWPSRKPSQTPSSQPTRHPFIPSSQPSMQPSSQPSRKPTSQPSCLPTLHPSAQPTHQPTSHPTIFPSSYPSMQPSHQPTRQPSTLPSLQPSSQPTLQPSSQPLSQPSFQPSLQPSLLPSSQPTSLPSKQPSLQPSSHPSSQPTSQPSTQPSAQPSSLPSCQPSKQPFSHPSCLPSTCPSSQPSAQPYSQPSSQPSRQPTMHPSCQPTSNPSQPSTQPSSCPSLQPSSQPSRNPLRPSSQPSSQPSNPSSQPSRLPSLQPSSQPSSHPSQQPYRFPSSQPTVQPSTLPSSQPSSQPFSRPSKQPSRQPSIRPTKQPFCKPSSSPTAQPNSRPSCQPSRQPSIIPSHQPSLSPSCQPSSQPVSHPSAQPSSSPSSIDYEWVVKVTRMDDFFDERDLLTSVDYDKDSKNVQWDFEKYCTNSQWLVNRDLTSSTHPNCTLRLALYYCLFRRPWSSTAAHQFFNNNTELPLLTCKIVVPFSQFSINADKMGSNIIINRPSYSLFSYQKSSSQIDTITNSRIHIDFQNSSLLVNNTFRIFYNHSVNNHFYLTISNVRFVSSNSTKPTLVQQQQQQIKSETKMNRHHLLLARAYLTDMRELNLVNVTFERVVLVASNIDDVNLVKIIVSHNLLQTVNNRFEIRSCRAVSIVESYFSNSSADIFGGSLCLIDVEKVIISSSMFVGNTAQYGSAIALHKVNSASFENNTFDSNIASVGGTVYWIYHPVEMKNIPLIPTFSNYFVNNVVSAYGSRVASSYYDMKPSIDSFYLTDYTSGGKHITITYSIIDAYGQVIPIYRGVLVVPLTPDFKNRLPQNCSYVLPTLVGVEKSFLKDGIVHFKPFGASCYPGGSFQMAFLTGKMTKYIDLEAGIEVFQAKKLLPIYFRMCRRGEIFDLYTVSAGTCSVCLNSFSVDDNLVEPFASKCTVCPKGALDCNLDQFLLKNGTWRYNSKTLKIFPCQSYPACLGGTHVGTYDCGGSHEGPLCGLCRNGFFLSQSNVCVSCGIFNVVQDLIVSYGIFFALLGVGYYLFKKYYHLVDKNFVSCLNIVIVTWQTILIGSGNKLRQNPNNTNNTSSIASLGILKFLNLELFSAKTFFCFYRFNYLFTVKVQTIAPIVLLILGLIYCHFIPIALPLSKLQNLLFVKSSLISFFLVIIPVISNSIIKSFHCIDLNPLDEEWSTVSDEEMEFSDIGYKFLVADLSINCESIEYKNHLPFIQCMAVIYSFAIPAYLWYLLYTSRDKLIIREFETINTKVASLTNAEIAVGKEYSMLPSLVLIYGSYKRKYWYFNIIMVVVRIFMTSYVVILFPANMQTVSNILVWAFVHRYLYTYRPCNSEIENELSVVGTFSVFTSYFILYFQENLMLGDVAANQSHYAILDRLLTFLTFLPGFYLFMHVCGAPILKWMPFISNSSRNSSSKSLSKNNKLALTKIAPNFVIKKGGGGGSAAGGVDQNDQADTTSTKLIEDFTAPLRLEIGPLVSLHSVLLIQAVLNLSLIRNSFIRFNNSLFSEKSGVYKHSAVSVSSTTTSSVASPAFSERSRTRILCTEAQLLYKNNDLPLSIYSANFCDLLFRLDTRSTDRFCLVSRDANSNNSWLVHEKRSDSSAETNIETAIEEASLEDFFKDLDNTKKENQQLLNNVLSSRFLKIGFDVDGYHSSGSDNDNDSMRFNKRIDDKKSRRMMHKKNKKMNKVRLRLAKSDEIDGANMASSYLSSSYSYSSSSSSSSNYSKIDYQERAEVSCDGDSNDDYIGSSRVVVNKGKHAFVKGSKSGNKVGGGSGSSVKIKASINYSRSKTTTKTSATSVSSLSVTSYATATATAKASSSIKSISAVAGSRLFDSKFATAAANAKLQSKKQMNDLYVGGVNSKSTKSARAKGFQFKKMLTKGKLAIDWDNLVFDEASQCWTQASLVLGGGGGSALEITSMTSVPNMASNIDTGTVNVTDNINMGTASNPNPNPPPTLSSAPLLLLKDKVRKKLSHERGEKAAATSSTATSTTTGTGTAAQKEQENEQSVDGGAVVIVKNKSKKKTKKQMMRDRLERILYGVR